MEMKGEVDDLNERLRDALEELGLSQAELCRRSGLHRMTVWRLLNEPSAPTAREKAVRALREIAKERQILTPRT